jgi:ribonuclease HI
MVVAFFDGASRGNPGESSAGACIIGDDGMTLWEECRVLGMGTNNEAEYQALVILLEEIKRRDLRGITVRGDSRLVISQVKGDWKVREERLKGFADRARSLVGETGAVLEWIPRELNTRADALSNRALDGEKGPIASSFPEERLERVSGSIFIAHGNSDYAVDVLHSSCSCPSFRARGRCKHLDAASKVTEREKKNCSSS